MRFVSKEPVEKGFSSDRKYRVTDENGTSYLLRETAITEKTRKEEEFRIMQRLEAMGLSMCRPVKLWWDESTVYSLHQWIEGEDLENVLPRLSEGTQYRLGLEAGRQLRIIHSVSGPENAVPWADAYGRKVARTLEKYEICSLRYEPEDFFLERTQEGLALPECRPTMLQHGDFHRANLMVDRQGNVVIIDFQKFGWGDPWEEFDSITWEPAG